MKKVLILVLAFAFVVSLMGSMSLRDPAFLSSSGPPRENLLLWLKADVGVVIESGIVTNWLDQSGHNLTLFSQRADQAPIYVSNYKNNKPSLYFSAGEMISTNSMSLPDAHTIIIAGFDDQLVNGQNSAWFSYTTGPGDSANVEFVLLYNGTPGKIHRMRYPSLDTSGDSPNLALTNFAIINQERYSISNLVSYVNGETNTVHTSVEGVIAASDLVRIGRHDSSSQQAFSHISEILVYGEALNNQKRMRVERYLNDKYRVH